MEQEPQKAHLNNRNKENTFEESGSLKNKYESLVKRLNERDQQAAEEEIDHLTRQARGGLSGSIMVSDAFFPFDDTVRTAAAAGVRYIVQPGGSKRDQDSIDACNELGVAMAFTGMRHFRH